MEREISRALRRELPVSVLMLDIDHFKRFNDVFGHEAGDVLLHDLAGAMQHRDAWLIGGKGVGQLSGPVGRGVVDHEESRTGQGVEDGPRDAADVLSLVVGRQHHPGASVAVGIRRLDHDSSLSTLREGGWR